MSKVLGLVIPGPIGYSETFFRSKVKGLMEEGFRVIIYCVEKQSSESDFEYIYQWPLARNPFLRMIQLTMGLLTLLTYPVRTLAFIREQRKNGKTVSDTFKGLYINGHLITGPRLNFLHFGFTTMAIGRETMGKVLDCQLSTSFRGYDVAIYPAKHGYDCYVDLWKNLDKVHTISDDLLNLAYHRLNLPRAIPACKITPAINTDKFALSKERAFFTGGKIKILSIGRLHWKKGHEYALMALKEIKQRGIDFHYKIVGSGESAERISFARKQLGLEKEVEIIGKVPHDQIPDLMTDGDIFLQPSVQEGFGNAVLEAQMAGMLCIVSDAEGLAENVLHQQTGWVVPKANAQALAEQLIQVIIQPVSQLVELSEAAQRRVRKDFDIKSQIAAFVKFYSDN